MERKKLSRRSRRKKDRDKKVIDKFNQKIWYTVHTPEMFGGDAIAETPSADPDQVIDRTLTTSLMDLTGDYKKIHVKLTFKINKVRGSKAYTYFYGHEYTRDFVRSMIRRRRTRIDGIFNVETKDGAKIRVSVIALTPFRCKTSHSKGIRNVMYEVVSKKAARLKYEDFVKELVIGKTATEIYKKARKVHPIQNVDVWKSRVVNLPTKEITEEEEEEAETEEEIEAEEEKEEIAEEEEEEEEAEEGEKKEAIAETS